MAKKGKRIKVEDLACNVKTKDPVRDNDDPTDEEIRVRMSVHMLHDAAEANGHRLDLVLKVDQEADLWIVACIQGDDNEHVNRGAVEYQVSNGPPGHRSESNDFYTLLEALEHFDREVARCRQRRGDYARGS